MIGDLVQRLIDSGTPPAVAAAVVAEAFAAGVRGNSADKVDEQAERRRAKDRERKAKVRGRSADSAEIPQTSENALTLTSSQEVETIKEVKKVRARKSSAHPCPLDFQPKQSHFEAADRLKIPHSTVHDKTEDMKIWAGSSGAVKADWDLTLHGFLRRDAEKLRNGTTGNRHGQAHPNGLSRALAGLREHVGDLERSEEGRGPPPRLLSHG